MSFFGQKDARIKELEEQLEQAKNSTNIAKEEARKNWKKYEDYYYETHSKTSHYDAIKKELLVFKEVENNLITANLEIEKFNVKQFENDRVVSRLKKQIERYKKKTDGL